MGECKKTIVIIKTNLTDIDPRLTKEIDSIRFDGNNVILLSWDREKTAKKKIINDYNYKEIRFRLKSARGIKILFYLPFWWIFVIYWLLILKFDFVHAINFDSIFAAVIGSKLRKKKLIYEMYDIYEDHILMPKIIRNFFVCIDKLFMRLANTIIIVDESRIEELNGIPNKNIVTIYNSPPDVFKTNFPIRKINSNFNIFYAGALDKFRSLEIMIDVVKSLENVKLTIAGFGELVDYLKLKSIEIENVDFIGKISYSEVLEWTLFSDLLFSLYDPIIPLNKYASSNKLFESMMCGKPILVSKGTSMEQIMEKTKSGVVVDCKNFQEIKEAIIKLKNDPDLCRMFGNNGRSAYKELYGWEIMEGRLLNIYNNMEK